VHYAHAILDEDATNTTHLDAAIIKFAREDEAAELLRSGIKTKGICRRKYFRCDAKVRIAAAIQLLNAFFPVDELVQEYFEVTEGWPGDDASA
jgi:hypothetical protein